MDGFTAKEISRLAGFEKPWMLNHLEREGTFVPENCGPKHNGKHRKYTFRDLVVLRAINRLLELGSRPRRIKNSIETFAELSEISNDADKLSAFANASGHFVVTSSKVSYCADNGQLLDLATNGQLTFSFMVNTKNEIAPVINAGLFLLDEVRNGVVRDDKFLGAVAKKFGL